MAVDFRIAPTSLKIHRWTPDFLDMLAQVGGLTFILYLILRIFVKTITDVKILYQASFYLYRKGVEKLENGKLQSETI